MIKYEIKYEHLKDDLVKDDKTYYHFNRVRKSANHYRLELNDEEFLGFFKISQSDKDVEWMMHKMSAYNCSFTWVLISYITY